MSLKFLLLYLLLHFKFLSEFLGAFLKNIGIVIMELILIAAVVEDARKKFKEMCREKYYIHIEFYLEDRISKSFQKIPKWKKSECV